MRIDYCPKCHKAGLRHEDSNGKGFDGLTIHERFNKQYDENPSELMRTDYESRMSNEQKKWCPRCGEWVDPVNQPYIGIKGRG